MSHTLYATFANPDAAEKAAGALLDRGVRAEDISVVRPGQDETAPRVTASDVVSSPGSVYGVEPDPTDVTADRADVANGDVDEIPSDVTSDAKAGAVKGSLVGAGIGAIVAIAALVVPGVGLVIGAGALASALAGIVATAGAGAAAGAIVVYLKDLGVDEETATEYGQTVEGGGAILAVTVPSGAVTEEEANAVLTKYAATNVKQYASRSYVA